MAMSPRAAVEAARHIVHDVAPGERGRLDCIARALKPNNPTIALPRNADAALAMLAGKAQTNFLPLVVDVLSQTLKVDGYRSAKAQDNADPWASLWQPNQMDARQTGVHRTALAYGVAYATVLPGEPTPVGRGVSPRQMTAMYGNPTEDEWPILALDDDGTGLLKLYDEEAVYYLSRERNLEMVEARSHNLGVCPVVRFRDRMLLDGDEQMGVVEPIISIQERIDETTFGLMVAQYFTAFKQRYVIGWVPETEREQLAASAAQLWTFEDPNVKVGEFQDATLKGYLDSKDSGIKDMAAISQLPPQNFAVGGVSNLSAEALASLEASKDRKGDEIATSLGESWEQWFRLGARAAGDDVGAVDFSAQVRWKDATARSLAQVSDAIVKLIGVGYPKEMAFEMLPGLSDQDLERAKGLLSASTALTSLTDMFAPK